MPGPVRWTTAGGTRSPWWWTTARAWPAAARHCQTRRGQADHRRAGQRLHPRSQGTEFNVYTFNADSPPTNTVLEGRFFADTVNAGVNGIAAVGADDGCYVSNALAALKDATTNKAFGNAWLYTDGDTYEGYRVNAVRQHLASRGLRGSTVLLGGCGSAATAPTDITGGEKSYLELAADGSQPSGMVPYLLTVLGTGGQFLYVAPDQLADAVAVLRAQLSHTAGAGRWSDYVSDTFTYRYDQLQSFEYQWFPAESLGQDMGQLDGDKRLTLPNPFSFYGETTDTMDVSPQGVIRADPCTFANPAFCPIIASTKHIDVLNGNMQWSYIAIPPEPPRPPRIRPTLARARTNTARRSISTPPTSASTNGSSSRPRARGSTAWATTPIARLGLAQLPDG
ncbi:MAG: hypothetical protein R2851_08280 [Caldilineaceae bacterium]